MTYGTYRVVAVQARPAEVVLVDGHGRRIRLDITDWRQASALLDEQVSTRLEPLAAAGLPSASEDSK